MKCKPDLKLRMKKNQSALLAYLNTTRIRKKGECEVKLEESIILVS